MILYQIAKQMEERAKLNRSIRESADGEAQTYRDEVLELERSLLAKASEWKQAEQAVLQP
jgi:hypothetical protein